MAEIVNLRTVRKRKTRTEKERLAEENRVLHGRPLAERRSAKAERERAATLLDGHRRGKPETGDEK